MPCTVRHHVENYNNVIKESVHYLLDFKRAYPPKVKKGKNSSKLKSLSYPVP